MGSVLHYRIIDYLDREFYNACGDNLAWGTVIQLVKQSIDIHGATLLTLVCRQPAAPCPPLCSCHLPLGPGGNALMRSCMIIVGDIFAN
jgi:hypothetical protein